MEIVTSAPEAFTRMWTILRTRQRTRRNLMKFLLGRLQIASILPERQSQLSVAVLDRRTAQAFWSLPSGVHENLSFDSVERRRFPDLLIHLYASGRSVIERLGEHTRVVSQLNRRAIDPELLEWAKSNVEAVPLIMVANDQPAQIGSAVAPVKARVMVRLAKQQRPSLLNGLIASIVNERTVHRNSAPLPSLQTESRQ